MKKIPIMLTFIVIAISMQSCQYFFYYFINKIDNDSYAYVNNFNTTDTLSIIGAKPIYAYDRKSALNTSYFDLYFQVFNNNQNELIYKETNLTLKYNQKIFDLMQINKYEDIRSQINKYYISKLSKDNFIGFSFSFEPGLKEGDTLTLFTNGILTYENGTKILPDSINIIVPD